MRAERIRIIDFLILENIMKKVQKLALLAFFHGFILLFYSQFFFVIFSIPALLFDYSMREVKYK